MSEIQQYLQKTFENLEQNINQKIDMNSREIKNLQNQLKELQKQQNNWEQYLNNLLISYNKLLNSFQATHEKLNKLNEQQK